MKTRTDRRTRPEGGATCGERTRFRLSKRGTPSQRFVASPKAAHPAQTTSVPITVPRPATVEGASEPISGSPDSAFQLYIREIGQTKLLTPEEEVSLARR